MSSFYRLYGCTIRCDFPLPAARPAPVGLAADLVINWAASPTPGQAEGIQAGAGEPLLSHQPDGAVRLVWPGEITADISGDGRAVHLQSRPEKLVFLPALAVGMILGIALHLRGTLCLHAATLEVDGRLVGLIGDSGAGKSTLAAWLLLRGATLYADDVTAIMPDAAGLPVVQPGPTGIRLCRDTAAALLPNTEGLANIPYPDKYLWDLSRVDAPCHDRYARTGRALSALYWLVPGNPGEGVCVSAPLAGTAALGKLMEASYPPMMRRMISSGVLGGMARLAETVPVRVVRYEQAWEQLPIIERILAR
ncbi:hypothetical protein GE253_23250 [Niveispirillum sp. SYP-B3756]|uniref:hypothetical protein n=1 Tax=Niveispirillum sp. SYP-B3756 TaxID=2662178 RepID=UPI00129145AC|nr:hypothetical protein [Niveispirillum sp. SYP-B3756]MQP68240.1 hypothetical protein [Niveispirillum sp. SYP-B3756]